LEEEFAGWASTVIRFLFVESKLTGLFNSSYVGLDLVLLRMRTIKEVSFLLHKPMHYARVSLQFFVKLVVQRTKA